MKKDNVVRNPQTGRILNNPEDFIKRLQRELREVYTSRSKLEEKLGVCVIEWRAEKKYLGTSNSIQLFDFNVGDIIANIGEVTSVNASKRGAGNRESSLTYVTIETRKLPTI